MLKLHFENEALRPREKFREMLCAAMEQYDPLEELLSLERELMVQEQKNGMPSVEFHLACRRHSSRFERRAARARPKSSSVIPV